MKQEKKSRYKKEVFVVQIGPVLKKALDQQMSSIKQVTYDTVDNSYYVAGEILGKKFLGLV